MELRHGMRMQGRVNMRESEAWVICPICGRKTKNRIRADTEAKRFPLWCPVCKHESVVDVTQGKVNISKI